MGGKPVSRITLMDKMAVASAMIIVVTLLVVVLGCNQKNDKAGLPPQISKLISEGSGVALYKVGIAYETGEGVSKDLEKAAKWYYEAATKGNVDSHYAIWRLWEEFSGSDLEPPFPSSQFTKSQELAIIGYKGMVKNSKDPELYYRLGLLYAEGIGAEGSKDRISRAYLAKAAEKGHEEAKKLLKFAKEFESESKPSLEPLTSGK
jgi:uncharacterized protein